ncbi:MATE family efflux transporter [Spirochaeta cellobiosiphila]|uniref:MATE family efflux transporter n=1 Tax=Spirochaeta cellobiosiphila TaxID=504483 RepID=UPI000402096E|nr:MATE family efflux transporter [Spirochaeta cellobiosiphila]
METNELFEKTPVPKAFFTLALPLVMSMVITLIYNVADTFFIAQTNNTALVAGVSIGAPLFTFMIAVGDIFGLGGASLISRLFGEKKDEEGKRVSVFCFYSSLIFGIIVAIFLLIFQTPILHLLGADGTTMVHAAAYYHYIALGAPLIILSFTPSNIVRSEGFSSASMKGSILGTVINIILDPIFIFLMEWGAAGAAIATIIGYGVTNIYFLWFVLKKSKKLSINPTYFKIPSFHITQVLLIGIPASITNFMQGFSLALTNHYLRPYGTDKIAAMGIVMKSVLIITLILLGFSFGAQPLMGYNYGSRNKKRLKSIVKFTFTFVGGLAFLLSILFYGLAPQLMTFFIDNSSVIANGTLMFRYQVITMTFMAMILVSTVLFQAVGKAAQAFILSAGRQGIVFAVFMLLLSRAAGYQGVILSQAASDIFMAIVSLLLLLMFMKKMK